VLLAAVCRRYLRLRLVRRALRSLHLELQLLLEHLPGRHLPVILVDYTYTEIAKLLDHSLLNPALPDPALVEGCLLARELDCASVCIVPHFLPRSVELLAGSTCLPTTTVGFPHGAQGTAAKEFEARTALTAGARELDMVVNVGKVKSHDWAAVERDIAAVTEVTHAHGARVKVIFENCYLTDDEKIRLCELCGELRADWVKTSTGYGTSGSVDQDLILMRKHSPPYVQVKAAGGIRTLDDVLRVRNLGVTRIGASASKAILDEVRRTLRK
jgi:deoxyribose-phosphate aldolase